MKTDIHPTYFADVTVTCACGNTFVTGSTQEAISVEVCSNCHPFYTGKQKLVDVAGRVDKFKKRLEETDTLKAQKKETKAKKTAKKTTKKDKEVKLSK